MPIANETAHVKTDAILAQALEANALLIAENRRLKERVSDLEEGWRVQFAKIDALNAIIVGIQS